LPKDPVPSRLVGAWSASPAQDISITLSLDNSKGFSWKVTDHGQPREFKGEATFGEDTLALLPPDQPPMVGKVAWKDDGHFQFQALGAPPSDPGLSFSK
ncbi:tetratricopeptide repeat protein, partial [Singulisphaera rosea]